MTATPDIEVEAEIVARESCGRTWFLMTPAQQQRHVAETSAIIVALDNYRAKHGVIPSYMEQVYVYPEDDDGNGQGHIGIYNADATRKLADVEGWHLFRFKDKDSTNDL